MGASFNERVHKNKKAPLNDALLNLKIANNPSIAGLSFCINIEFMYGGGGPYRIKSTVAKYTLKSYIP
jgi:hypothetical protein